MTNPIAPFIAQAAYPEDIERILGRCRHDPDTGCLVWAGALSGGHWPRVYVTNPATGQRTVTVGRRGVWMAMKGKAVPQRWRVFGTCNNPLCISPDHTRCGQPEAWGKHLQDTQHYKARPNRIAANRAIGQTRRKVMDEHMHLVHSNLTLDAVALAIGVNRSTVSRYRRSETVAAIQNNPFAGLFSGLVRA